MSNVRAVSLVLQDFVKPRTQYVIQNKFQEHVSRILFIVLVKQQNILVTHLHILVHKILQELTIPNLLVMQLA